MSDGQLQRGIHPVLYTFFNQDGSLDSGAIRDQVEWTLQQGAHGIVTLGIASEVGKLDVEERRTVAQTVAEAINGRAPLGVTVAEPSVPGQVRFVQFAKDLGANWVILQSPQVKTSEAALVEFTAAVADSTDLPCAVQSNPGNMDVALSNSALRQLIDRCANIRLLKAEGDVASVSELASDKSLAVFGGRNGLELVSAIAAGMAGNVPAPELTRELVRTYEVALSDGGKGLERARELHNRVLPMIVFLNHNLATQLCYGKKLLAHRMGIEKLHDRAPMLRASSFGIAEMHRLLDRISSD